MKVLDHESHLKSIAILILPFKFKTKVIVKENEVRKRI